MGKDFDGWSAFKKRLDTIEPALFAHSRELWWCSLGVNVGTETDGKNLAFERPIVVMRVYNRESLAILPLTRKPKLDRHHFPIEVSGSIAYAKLTQTRTISAKRLLRKIGTVDSKRFELLRAAWKASL